LPRNTGCETSVVYRLRRRGEADQRSDLDLLVEPMPGFTLLKSSAMSRELEGLLGRRVDVVSDRGLRERIKDRGVEEAVPL
jgi:predicted nucleotidyltransferase